ncbi:Ger(x)C family spore germination protein [Jeotgalibacillus proteolyticus]|nr:Ger(x)C family spore germination protein [Jeotgalibacillus proteolyticus]
MKNLLIIFLLLSGLLFGCSGDLSPSSVEDVALVSLLGVDYVDENKMKLTLAVPQSASSSEEPNQVYSTVSGMVKEGIVDLSAQAEREIKLNGLRVVLFNEEFARSGRMREVVEHLYRNPVIGGNVYVVVVKESAEELLSGKYPSKSGIVTYLNALLKPKPHNMFSPFTTIHDFMYTQTNPVLETMTPYIEKKEDVVEITGVTVFKEKKMTDLYDRKQGQLIQLLKDVERMPAATIQLNEDRHSEQVVIDFVKNKVDYKSNGNIHQPSLSIILYLKGTIYEYKGTKNLSRSRDFSELENEIQDYFKKEVSALIEELKQNETDPIGFSENFRMHYKGEWTQELTDQVFSDLSVTVSMEMHILATGTLR